MPTPEDCPCCNPPWAMTYKKVQEVKITQRLIDGPESAPVSAQDGDYGAVITPTGSGFLRQVYQEDITTSPFILSSAWITGTRENSVTTKNVALGNADLLGSTIDFGADSNCINGTAKDALGGYLFIGGEPDGSGNTLKIYSGTPKTLDGSSSALDVRVNAISANGLARVVAAGKGTGSGTGTIDPQATLISFGTTGQTAWSADPTGGVGEGNAVFVPSIFSGSYGSIGYKGITGTGSPSSHNIYTFDSSNGNHIDSAEANGGADVYALLPTTMSSPTEDGLLVAGDTDGNSSVELFRMVGTSGVFRNSVWTYNTGSRILGMTTVAFGSTARLVVVGERNTSIPATMWVLDLSNGSLVGTYDHGDDLRDVIPYAPNHTEVFVIGDRV